MRTTRLYSTLLICALSSTIQAADLETTEQKASYAFGVDILENLKRQGLELDADAFTQGIRDSASGKELKLDTGERNEAKQALQLQLQQKLLAQKQAVADSNRQQGKAFLEANAKKDGVKVTDSGLQYKVIKAGSGKTPKASDTVVTHYRGTLIDGREFDSSYKRDKPATFPVGGVIKGWTEALQLMKEGAKWELYIPSELAYGGQKRGELITPNSTLVFEIELLEVK